MKCGRCPVGLRLDQERVWCDAGRRLANANRDCHRYHDPDAMLREADWHTGLANRLREAAEAWKQEQEGKGRDGDECA